MGHYAKVINGLVVDGNVATQEWVDAQPKIWYIDWVQTSFNVYGGVYYDPETRQPVENQAEAIAEQDGRQRKNYAGIGYRYDSERDAFIPPTPYPSWKLNEDTCLWDAPIPKPQDNKRYIWNEAAQEWTYTGYYLEDGELKKEEITGE
jgi:hypothetical protein